MYKVLLIFYLLFFYTNTVYAGEPLWPIGCVHIKEITDCVNLDLLNEPKRIVFIKNSSEQNIFLQPVYSEVNTINDNFQEDYLWELKANSVGSFVMKKNVKICCIEKTINGEQFIPCGDSLAVCSIFLYSKYFTEPKDFFWLGSYQTFEEISKRLSPLDIYLLFG